MPASLPKPVPAVPPGHRLLHIGIPKTGTTALQHAASSRRQVLLDHGACYPGHTLNHREQAAALMGRVQGWAEAGSYVPDPARWQELTDELRRHPHARGFVSHEFIAECTDEQAERFLAELGPDLHVVVTLRGHADLLGSTWQQYVKAGNTTAFEPWLRRALSTPPSPKLPKSFARRTDQAAIVRRWTRLVGPERMTAVIVDKTRPTLLTDTFESLLGLPVGTLHAEIQGGYAANRTLSLAEAEVVRRVNEAIGKRRVDWTDYETLVRRGAVAWIQERRRPAADEPGLALPGWAAERALELAADHAQAIRDAGCRVVGDLAVLTRPVAIRDSPVPDVEQVPMELTVGVVVGLLAAAAGRDVQFEPIAPELSPRVHERIASTSLGRRALRSYAVTRRLDARSLAASLGLRLAERWRRRRRSTG